MPDVLSSRGINHVSRSISSCRRLELCSGKYLCHVYSKDDRCVYLSFIRKMFGSALLFLLSSRLTCVLTP